MNLGLEGKVALVTGAGRDIGREIALTLGREGAAVAVNYLKSRSAAEATAAEIRSAGGRALAVGADISDYAAVQAMVERVKGEWGSIDVLVNNAGLVHRKFFLQTKPEEWRAQIDVGLYGVLNCCHAVAPAMVERKGGRIINIAGDSARVGQAQLAITAAARGGVLSLTRTLARELGRSAITVNAVAFGWVETGHIDPDFWAGQPRQDSSGLCDQAPGTSGGHRAAGRLPRLGSAAWITGQTLSISGGYTTI